MKLFLLLVLVPLVYCASINERFLFDDVQQLVSEVVAALGTDYTEARCENVCLGLLHTTLGSSTCPGVCRAAQTVIKTLQTN